MKFVLGMAGRGGCRGLQKVEVRLGRRIVRRIQVRYFPVPEVELIGPRAQPVVLIERRPLEVRVRLARDGIGSDARARAARGIARGGLIDPGCPAGTADARAAAVVAGGGGRATACRAP